MPPLKPCLTCGTLSSGTYCGEHATQKERERNQSRTPRGQRYGSKHQAERAAWVPIVALGQQRCRRCLERIIPGTAWDLGHPDAECDRPTGPEHAYRCNRAAAGRASHNN